MIAREFFGIWDSICKCWVMGEDDTPYISTDREIAEATCANLVEEHRNKFKECLSVECIADTKEIGKMCSIEIAASLVNGSSDLGPPNGIL